MRFRTYAQSIRMRLYIKLFLYLFLFSLGISFAYYPSPEDWRDHVSYMIMIDRYNDGDPTNDNANGTYNPTSGTGIHGGDLAGITQKLDYLKDLGITAIWISPVPKNDGDYHGYAAVDWEQPPS